MNKIKGIYYKKYENKKSDQNLVFIHGSGCNHKFLQPLAKVLEEFNCYLIDLPSHGNSEKQNCDTIEDYIYAVSTFVASLKNVTLIGHSLGGAICLGVAARGISTVKRTVVLNSGAKFDQLNKKFMDKVYNNKVDKFYLLRCCGSFFSPIVYKQLRTFEPDDIIIKDLKIGDKVNLESKLNDIQIPTLIVTGKSEILTLVEYSEQLNEQLSNSELVVVPRTRHMLPIAKRKYVGGLIRKFVSQQ